MYRVSFRELTGKKPSILCTCPHYYRHVHVYVYERDAQCTGHVVVNSSSRPHRRSDLVVADGTVVCCEREVDCDVGGRRLHVDWLRATGNGGVCSRKRTCTFSSSTRG